MKDLPNTDSGLFPVEHMNRTDAKKKSKKIDVKEALDKLSKMPIPNWSQVVDKCVENAKKFVKDPDIESVDVRLTKDHVAINLNYKEKK